MEIYWSWVWLRLLLRRHLPPCTKRCGDVTPVLVGILPWGQFFLINSIGHILQRLCYRPMSRTICHIIIRNRESCDNVLLFDIYCLAILYHYGSKSTPVLVLVSVVISNGLRAILDLDLDVPCFPVVIRTSAKCRRRKPSHNNSTSSPIAALTRYEALNVFNNLENSNFKDNTIFLTLLNLKLCFSKHFILEFGVFTLIIYFESRDHL